MVVSTYALFDMICHSVVGFELGRDIEKTVQVWVSNVRLIEHEKHRKLTQ